MKNIFTLLIFSFSTQAVIVNNTNFEISVEYRNDLGVAYHLSNLQPKTISEIDVDKNISYQAGKKIQVSSFQSFNSFVACEIPVNIDAKDIRFIISESKGLASLYTKLVLGKPRMKCKVEFDEKNAL